ncbi:MAG TPA: GH25 family lysozyme [Mycobacteriales bacterium]
MPSAMQVAESQLGNADPSAYWNLVWPDRPAVAVDWCAIFVSWCFATAGVPLPKMDETAVTSGFAYCPDAETWAKQQGHWSETPSVGDVVLYCWDGSGTAQHTGIVTAVNADGSVSTVEGNTVTATDPTYGVYAQTRSGPDILGYVTGLPFAPTLSAAEVIDISSFQHPSGASIDFAAVKGAGISGVVVKITEGTDYVNPYAAADVAAAKAAGLSVAGYLFLHPSEDPVAQAEYYLANGGSDLAGVALDCEDTDGLGWGAVCTAMQQCHDHLALVGAKQVLAYLDESWYAATGISSWGWQVWLAEPSDSSPTEPCQLWQYGQSAVAGVQGAVDHDRWVGSQAAYDSFFGVAGPAPDPPAPAPPVPAPSPSSNGGDVTLPDVSSGSSLTYWVETVQSVCKEKMGQSSLAVDGDFGPETETAVKDVQSFFGLSVDGIVGPETWPVLLGL